MTPELKAKVVHDYSDLQLIVNQVMGEYQVGAQRWLPTWKNQRQHLESLSDTHSNGYLGDKILMLMCWLNCNNKRS